MVLESWDSLSVGLTNRAKAVLQQGLSQMTKIPVIIMQTMLLGWQHQNITEQSNSCGLYAAWVLVMHLYGGIPLRCPINYELAELRKQIHQ